jgi:hypothetical protein
MVGGGRGVGVGWAWGGGGVGVGWGWVTFKKPTSWQVMSERDGATCLEPFATIIRRRRNASLLYIPSSTRR